MPINIRTWKKYMGNQDPIDFYEYSKSVGYSSPYGAVGSLDDSDGDPYNPIEKRRIQLADFLESHLIQNGYVYDRKTDTYVKPKRRKKH